MSREDQAIPIGGWFVQWPLQKVLAGSTLANFVSSGDVVPKDVNAAVATIKTKRTIQFVDW